MRLQNNNINTKKEIKKSHLFRLDIHRRNVKIHPDHTPKILADWAGRTILMPQSLMQFSNNIPTEYYALGEKGAVRIVCEKYLRSSVKIAELSPKLTNDHGLIRTASLLHSCLSDAMYCPFFDDWNTICDTQPEYDKAGAFLKIKMQKKFKTNKLTQNEIGLVANVLSKNERDDFKRFINFLFEEVNQHV